MMRMSVTTHNVLDRLHNWPGFRPYNFFLYPILADCGYPGSVGDPKKFSLVAPFESDQSKWPDSKCTNIGDPFNPDPKKYTLITDFASPLCGTSTVAIADTFKNLLYRYMMHPEAKSLGPDGKPCKRDTRGRLQRVHVIAGSTDASARNVTDGKRATISSPRCSMRLSSTRGMEREPTRTAWKKPEND
jgi:hypothetical protein